MGSTTTFRFEPGARSRTRVAILTVAERFSRLQFERFLHQCGLATREDLRALARKLDDVNLRFADLSENLEETA